MTKKLVAYDRSHMKIGLKPAELKSAFRSLASQKQRGELGFLAIPELKKELAETERLARELRKKHKTLVVIGIGGSDLGARTLIQALRKRGEGMMAVRFIGANTDPEEIADLLAELDWKTTVLNVVSKSGGTLEPMGVFLLLRDRLVKAVGAKKAAARIVATTDRKGGALRTIAEREGYRTLPVPGAVGGRFSVLTPVGLFPAACAGISIRRLVRGAKAEFEAFFEEKDPVRNGPLAFAGLQHQAYRSGQGRMAVLMPYAARLERFGKWFVQLWGESLGKARDRQGKTVNAGQTPIAALGATDQHSQIQLYNEGPFDKTVTFIGVERFRAELSVPKAFADLPEIAYLGGHRFGDILNIERRATAEALFRHGRPNGTVMIEKITPETVGALMAFFMLATAAMGELLDVNAYDQPGVEEGKRIIGRMMGKG
ncbi:glucose-6-phosphate isomerase [Candidatus Uhrbacteria bacterium]|nr:glucose-6-phosphate isomerase [Candidatus Uhrbacteria bacterium]